MIARADRQPRIIQIIPYDGIGGVEIAAASVPPGDYHGFTFEKAFLATKGAPTPTDGVLETGVYSENDPRAYWRTFRAIIKRRPDVLVLSLWRSCIVGLAVKLVRPRTHLVLFLHNSENAHLADTVVTHLTARLSRAIWADSASTAKHRVADAAHPISFLTERIGVRTADLPAPNFIFWGRLHARKQLPRAIAIFKLISNRHAAARFTIIGPDGGDAANLETLVTELGLGDRVTFPGVADHGEIARLSAGHSFFLQTSRAEGMAMATVEAMQLGLVPLVTPVGEIAAYVKDGTSGVWIDDDEAAATAIERLLGNAQEFRRIRANAINIWLDHPLYRDEFLAACCALLDSGRHRVGPARGAGDQSL